MNLKSIKSFLTTTFMTIVAALIVASFMDNSLMIYIMMAFFVIYAVVYLFFWKCPHCKKHLGKLVVRECKHCKHKLDL